MTVLRSPRVLSLILYPVLSDNTMRAAVVKQRCFNAVITFSAYGYSHRYPARYNGHPWYAATQNTL